MPFTSKNKSLRPTVFQTASFTQDNPLLKREQFAVSLRKQKKSDILSKKRQRLLDISMQTLNNSDQFIDQGDVTKAVNEFQNQLQNKVQDDELMVKLIKRINSLLTIDVKTKPKTILYESGATLSFIQFLTSQTRQLNEKLDTRLDLIRRILDVLSLADDKDLLQGSIIARLLDLQNALKKPIFECSNYEEMKIQVPQGQIVQIHVKIFELLTILCSNKKQGFREIWLQFPICEIMNRFMKDQLPVINLSEEPELCYKLIEFLGNLTEEMGSENIKAFQKSNLFDQIVKLISNENNEFQAEGLRILVNISAKYNLHFVKLVFQQEESTLNTQTQFIQSPKTVLNYISGMVTSILSASATKGGLIEEDQQTIAEQIVKIYSSLLRSSDPFQLEILLTQKGIIVHLEMLLTWNSNNNQSLIRSADVEIALIKSFSTIFAMTQANKQILNLVQDFTGKGHLAWIIWRVSQFLIEDCPRAVRKESLILLREFIWAIEEFKPQSAELKQRLEDEIDLLQQCIGLIKHEINSLGYVDRFTEEITIDIVQALLLKSCNRYGDQSISSSDINPYCMNKFTKIGGSIVLQLFIETYPGASKKVKQCLDLPKVTEKSIFLGSCSIGTPKKTSLQSAADKENIDNSKSNIKPFII